MRAPFLARSTRSCNHSRTRPKNREVQQRSTAETRELCPNDDIGSGFHGTWLMSVYPSSAKNLDFRRADRIRGLVIVGLAFVLCLLLSLWAKRRATPEQSIPPAPPTTAGLTGYPKAVDPVKSLALARTLTPRNLLRGISADWVERTGLVDLAAHGRVRYFFQSAVGQGPQPKREPGTLARRPYCGRQTVTLSKAGAEADVDNAEAACASPALDPLPEPHCTMADIWAYALAHGVTKDRVAHIEYYRASAGPAWRFDIGGTTRFTLYGDCKRELDGHDALSVGF